MILPIQNFCADLCEQVEKVQRDSDTLWALR